MALTDTPQPDAAPAPDLTGLDQFKPPSMPGMSDLNANVQSAEQQQQRAQQNLDTQIADVPQAPQKETFSQPAPQRNIGSLMAMSPWLIILSTFGGMKTKMSANQMLQSTTGMIDGLVQGDEKKYQAAYEKWDQQRQQFADMQTQKWKIYQEMVKVYKDQIDGKERALQVAEAAVRDARKDRQNAMQNYLQTVRAGIALRDESRKWSALDESIRSHKANEAEKVSKDTGKTGAAATKTKEQKTQAEALIDDLIKQLDAAGSKGPFGSITGVGGMIRRGVETAANVTGVSNDTTAHDFETKLSELQLLMAPLLAGSRTAKDQREKIEKVVRGLKAGDTRQNTRQALLSLKQQLSGLDDQESARGAVVRTGTSNGRKVVQYQDGTIEYAN